MEEQVVDTPCSIRHVSIVILKKEKKKEWKYVILYRVDLSE